jgi:hypothetical protein
MWVYADRIAKNGNKPTQDNLFGKQIPKYYSGKRGKIIIFFGWGKRYFCILLSRF